MTDRAAMDAAAHAVELELEAEVEDDDPDNPDNMSRAELVAALRARREKEKPVSKANLPALELAYFGIAGRAEPVRLALVLGGVPFTNRVCTGAEFGALKAAGELPFEQLPTLLVTGRSARLAGGELIAQSRAMLLLAGKLGGLYPADPMRAAQCDVWLSVFDDMSLPIGVSSYPERAAIAEAPWPEDVKLAMRQRIAATHLPRYLALFERQLAKHSEAGDPMMGCDRGGWLLEGDAPTLCDLTLACNTGWLQLGILDGVSPDILKLFPYVVAHRAQLLALPEVAGWYELKEADDGVYVTRDWEPPPPDEEWVALADAKVCEQVGLKTAAVGALKAGDTVLVFEQEEHKGHVRAKIKLPGGTVGWTSLQTKTGKLILERKEELTAEQQLDQFESSKKGRNLLGSNRS